MSPVRLTELFVQAIESLGGIATPEQIAKKMGLEGSKGSLKMLGFVASDLVREGRLKRNVHSVFYELCSEKRVSP